MTNKMNSY